MTYIKIFDTTLRDGEQSPGINLSRYDKLGIAKQLKILGIDIIEAGFPFSSPEDYEAVKKIAKEVRGPVICGLARLTKEDIDKCWGAVRYSENPRIHTFVATSDIHMHDKLRKSPYEIKDLVYRMVSYSKSLCEDIEFSPEDASRTSLDFMGEVIYTAIESGATTINIPDTVGYSQPDEFGKKIKYIFDTLGSTISKNNVTISCHCHDDLGNAVANSLAAIRNGATQVECTINGIGERAGNASLEEIIMNLIVRKDYFDCRVGVDTTKIYETSRMVSEMTGMVVQPNKAIVGRNAFSHESGIHQDGVVKNPSTYEIMNPDDVGWVGENFVIGRHSGKTAISKILTKLGYELDNENISRIVMAIKSQTQGTVSREELVKIANKSINSHKNKTNINN